jgi:hypothetical protein
VCKVVFQLWGSYYCQELQRDRKDKVMWKVGIIDYSVSSYCGGDGLGEAEGGEED